MGWFDKQIRERMASDQNALEDSFFQMASVVMDKWEQNKVEDSRLIAKESLDQVLKFYHHKPVEVPETIKDVDEQMQYILRPLGLMIREVKLDEGWQNNAYGPMLGYIKDKGTSVALIPGVLFGYYYYDPVTGVKTHVNRKNAKLFSEDAICFYHPLPMKKIGIPDLLWYMWKSISVGDIVLVLIATFVLTMLGFIGPKVMSLITGPILTSRNLALMAGVGTFLLCSTMSTQLVQLIRTLLMERINTKTSQAVESSVMMRLLALPISFFRKYSSGELSSRATSISSLCSMMINSVFSIGLSSLMSLLYVAQIFEFAPALVVPSIIIIVLTVLLSLLSSLVQIGISRKRMELDAKETGMSYAILNGMQKVKLSGSEKRVFARWGRLYSQGAKLDYNPPMFLKINPVISKAVTLFGMVVIYYLSVRTNVGVSNYIAFSAAYGNVTGAFQALAGIAISVAAIKPVLEMAEPILKAEPEVAEGKQAIDHVTGHIEMSHVTFRYDENLPCILTDMNLDIKAGEYVAIVGRTGCGKSTLVRLLLGFEKPEYGAIFYDNHELASVDPRTLRKHIGVVIQNGQLFQGDIFSNISISAPQLTMDEAWEVAEIAGIAQNIREMPMGMHTVISEGQGGISGGQKQRLMIARAIAPKPKILIFDEATSALDNKTQKQVSDALDKLKCTRIVIAHRLSTIRNCDRILVMDEGKIVEEGTYEDLIAQNGYFADLVARQRADLE